MRRSQTTIVFLAVLASCVLGQSYVNYESPQTHPIAVTPDGMTLLAVNTPDNRLSVFSLANPSSPVLLKEIAVGMEPVSVAAWSSDEIWVVNHLSDSVSIISLALGVVTDTIYVKDEPADVVFAGSPLRAFVSVSQSNLVNVYDLSTHGLVASIPIFGEDPRALAVKPDGSAVYVVVTESGNGTTTIPFGTAPPQSPPTNTALPTPPVVGRVVSITNPAFAAQINFTLPDNDVVQIDANQYVVTTNYSGVGTMNFGIAVQPGTGNLWVANTEARNLTFFEPVLKGHVVDNRVTRVAVGSAPATVTPFDLNPSTNYTLFPDNASLSSALASPTDVIWNAAGTQLYVAALGTDRIGIVAPNGAVTARIDLGPAGPTTNPRTKKGPRGLALHPIEARLYVLNRLSQTVQTIDTGNNTVLSERKLAVGSPETLQTREGRGFLYDAKLSANGTMSCASCHVDANWDHIAWDLGDPGGNMLTVANPFPAAGQPSSYQMHPMKGPMTTQPLKGITGATPLHWRGDRLDMNAFNVAFQGLLGGNQLTPPDLIDFSGYVGTIQFPPNPNRGLDNSLPATLQQGSPAAGQTFFTTNVLSGGGVNGLRCVDCHAGTATTNRSILTTAQTLQPQNMKVPQLRFTYEKLGFQRGAPSTAGFGFNHEGSGDTLNNVHSAGFFGTLAGAGQLTNRLNVGSFLLCMETGSKPIVGYSRTVTSLNAASTAVATDFTLLTAQVTLGNCDLVAEGTLNSAPRSWYWDPATQSFRSDRSAETNITWTNLRAQVASGAAWLTLMAVPPGSGIRIGIDRDLDGTRNGDEGLTNSGASSAGCYGNLTLTGNSEPKVNNTEFALVMENVQPGAGGLLAFGLGPSNFSVFGVNVLINLGPGPFVTLDLAADSAGRGVVGGGIPNVASLVGVNFWCQAFFADACGSQGLAATPALKITIQP